MHRRPLTSAVPCCRVRWMDGGRRQRLGGSNVGRLRDSNAAPGQGRFRALLRLSCLLPAHPHPPERQLLEVTLNAEHSLSLRLTYSRVHVCPIADASPRRCGRRIRADDWSRRARRRQFAAGARESSRPFNSTARTLANTTKRCTSELHFIRILTLIFMLVPDRLNKIPEARLESGPCRRGVFRFEFASAVRSYIIHGPIERTSH